MSFRLSAKQWEQIARFQAHEVERLASDVDFARRASLTGHYSRIGHWLRPESGTRVLELGCGPGRYVAMLASLGFDVTGVDACPAGSFPSWELVTAHRAVEFRNDVYAEELPFAAHSFDQVACIGALLYFRDPQRALAEIRRVLRPKGRLLMRTVNRRNLYRLRSGSNLDPAAPNTYTMRELTELLSGAGFVVEQAFSYGFYPPVFPGGWWWLVNGKISLRVQSFLSALTPPQFRINLVLLCRTACPEAG